MAHFLYIEELSLIRMRRASNEKEKEIMDMEGLTKWVEGRTTGFEQITEANKYLNFLENFNEKR